MKRESEAIVDPLDGLTAATIRDIIDRETLSIADLEPAQHVLLTRCRLPFFSVWCNKKALDAYVDALDRTCHCGQEHMVFSRGVDLLFGERQGGVARSVRDAAIDDDVEDTPNEDAEDDTTIPQHLRLVTSRRRTEVGA
jgi:hypothetical protein